MRVRGRRTNDLQDCLGEWVDDVPAVVQALLGEAHASGDTTQLKSDVCVLKTCLEAAQVKLSDQQLQQLKSSLELHEEERGRKQS